MDTPPAFQAPWVKLKNVRWGPLQFASSVMRASKDAHPGDIVTVYGPDDLFAGRGFYNPKSNYAVRILTRADEPVDAGWFRDKLTRAVQLRRQTLNLDAITDTYRLVHAEGDSLSSLIADKLGSVLSIEAFSLGIWRQLPVIAPILCELADCQTVHMNMDERIKSAEGLTRGDRNQSWPPELKHADPAQRLIVTENGMRFRVRLGGEAGGHKTGFFCDQRDNRMRLSKFTAGKSVLDICAYSGGFSCYAKKLGQAGEVIAVDLDEKAIEIARENANLNQARIELVHADAFSYMRQMQTNARTFDVVVLDPPKFVSNPDEMREGRQKYIDLNKLACAVLPPGGLLLSCSCSGLVPRDEFVKMVCDAGRYTNRRVQLLDVTGPGTDHPVMSDYPEGSYLKAVWARVM